MSCESVCCSVCCPLWAIDMNLLSSWSFERHFTLLMLMADTKTLWQDSPIGWNKSSFGCSSTPNTHCQRYRQHLILETKQLTHWISSHLTAGSVVEPRADNFQHSSVHLFGFSSSSFSMLSRTCFRGFGSSSTLLKRPAFQVAKRTVTTDAASSHAEKADVPEVSSQLRQAWGRIWQTQQDDEKPFPVKLSDESFETYELDPPPYELQTTKKELKQMYYDMVSIRYARTKYFAYLN